METATPATRRAYDLLLEAETLLTRSGHAAIAAALFQALGMLEERFGFVPLDGLEPHRDVGGDG